MRQRKIARLIPTLLAGFFVLALAGSRGDVSLGQDAYLVSEKEHVTVKPVFLVPKGEQPPTTSQEKRLLRHLEWAQRRYRELLANESTFEAETDVEVFHSEHPLDYYRKQTEMAAPQIASELLKWQKVNRFSCRNILLVVLMNAKDQYPVGGGRPFNGGINTGGGIVIISSHALDRSANFQSTLQHELGHAFGLPHVDVYGYDMKRNASIMSYNPQHHTRNFKASNSPGTLIPEDLRVLAINDRVFKDFEFETAEDVPAEYKLSPRLVPLGPMSIPDQSNGIKVTTKSGETYGSSVMNVVHNRIRPSVDTGKVTFDPKSMWQSDKLNTNCASLTIEFPTSVELDSIVIYSQHSGKYHAVAEAKLFCQTATEERKLCAAKNFGSSEGRLEFDTTSAQRWTLELYPDSSKAVVVRGLRFFRDGRELFSPLIPVEHETN